MNQSAVDAQNLHRDAIVIDAHCDFLYRAVLSGRRLADDTKDHVTLTKLQQGGITAQFFAVFDHWDKLDESGEAVPRFLKAVEAFHAELDTHPGNLLQARAAADIERAKAEHKIACVLSMEGVEPVGEDLSLLSLYHRLGVRCIGLTWNYPNQVADGLGVQNPGGLTDFGRELIAEMERLGILIDIAHLAPPGVDDVFRLAQRPVIASHANAQAICNVSRNLSDRQLDLVADSGGVVGITFEPSFLDKDRERSSLHSVVQHIDYIKSRIGSEHIALGSDFEGYWGVTAELEDASKVGNITTALQDKGYADEEIRGILGLNLLRVFRDVAG
jgi:membrane dipeptidase